MSLENVRSLENENPLRQIERRFRLHFPDDIPTQILEKNTHVNIRQCFDQFDGLDEVRFRELTRDDGTKKFTRVKKSGYGIERDVYENEIDEANFHDQWLDSTQRINKKRYYIPVEDKEDYIELDYYEEEQKPFVIASIKFSQLSEAQQFTTPDWMEKAGCFEVTDIDEFRDFCLSRYRPVGKVFEKELSQHKASSSSREDPYLNEEAKASDIFEFLGELTSFYAGYRTVERQIFGNQKGHAPQETDAEHSWHAATLMSYMYEKRDEFGIVFDDKFDINQAGRFGLVHDAPEVWATDTDAMEKDPRKVLIKSQLEHEALGLMLAGRQTLGTIALDAFLYDQKCSPESRIINDCDKFAGIFMIIQDSGRKWREQHGNTTTIDRHKSMVEQKILTPLGKSIWRVVDLYLGHNPQLFAAKTVRPEILNK